MENPLKSAVLYGSARRERQGIRAARFIAAQLEARGHAVDLVDSEAYPLPFLDRMYKEFAAGEAPEAMQRVGEILAAADGFVVVSGEYNHSIPPVLKNLLDHYQAEYLYKPSALVTYSAGPFGGVRALINLRGIMAELGSPAIPSALPISQVWKNFADDGRALDPAYEQRAGKFLVEYEWYCNALKRQRECTDCAADSPMQQGISRGR